MFTGIITDVGNLRSMEKRGDTRMVITTAYPVENVEIGASIACSGVCLTVVDKGRDADGQAWFAVDASAETLNCTNLGKLAPGHRINLERALRIGDELGGHIVSGHVDGQARITAIRPEGGSIRYSFASPRELARYIAPKGSVALDGVSLTVNEVGDQDGAVIFGVNVIPHTQQMTTFGNRAVGDLVNMEVDVVARYVDRLNQAER
ncbi:MAG: riboflavin synthase [Pseudomonadota bacterium]|jgi:riboflavin synthase|nr:riboflavin synthase [Alphaproteobacteria bacterium]